MDSQSTFFRPGGTLEPGAECYIARKADEPLLSALLRGEYVFLLDSRQKGKSSLIARSILKLREAGVRQVKLDLQRIGANVTPEQWYAGLAVGVGQELGLQARVLEYWQERQAVGPLARFIGVLQDVILPNTTDPLVVFVDEVDFVRALTFPTDEFFAAIRESFNRRSSDESFKRLTFCLVGVATPGQLIRNPDISPFNIGVRIDLTDFTLEETLVYSDSLNGKRDGARLVARVHYWVSGHPYLTQLLCGRIASEPGVVTTADVDRLVRTLFLSPESRQREPNLSDVERRMLDPDVPGLTPEERRIQVLELYGRMLRAKSVDAVEQNPVVATLRLSGVGLEHDGILQVRNRVYRTVFDETWRQQNLPEAEVRRQTGASRRATLRTAAIASVVVLAVAAAAVGFFKISEDRESALIELGKRSEELHLQSYIGTMASIRLGMQAGRWTTVSELIDQSKGNSLRGWEWGHVAQMISTHVAEDEVPPTGSVFEEDPAGYLNLITVSSVYRVTTSGMQLQRHFKGKPVRPINRNGDLRLGTDIETGRYVIRDANTDQIVGGSEWFVRSYDPDARTLIVVGGGGHVRLSSFDGKVLKQLGKQEQGVVLPLPKEELIKLSPDGLLTRTNARGTRVAESKITPGPRGRQAFFLSKDTKLLLHTDGIPRLLQVLRASDLSVVATLDAPTTVGAVASFASDNRKVLVGVNGVIVCYDLQTGKALQNYYGHKAEISELAFLPGGRHFASVDRSGAMRVWPLNPAPAIQEIAALYDPPRDLIRCDDPNVILSRTLGEAFESRNLRTDVVSRLAQPAGSGSQEPFAVVGGTKIFVGTSSGRLDRYSADGLRNEKSVQLFKTLVYGMGILGDGKWLLVRSNVGKPHRGEQYPPHTTAEYAIVDTESLAVLHRFSPDWPLPGVNYVGLVASEMSLFALVANRWWAGPNMESPGEVRLVSAESGKILRRMEFRDRIRAAALTPDGSRLIVAFHNSLDTQTRVEVFETATGKQVGSLKSPNGLVIEAFDRRNDLLIGKGVDGNIVLWDLSKGSEFKVISAGQRIEFLDVSPDGDRISTDLADGDTMIWDVRTGTDRLTLFSPDQAEMVRVRVPSRSIFSADGTRLIRFGRDGVLRSFNSVPWKDQPRAEAKKGP